MFNTGKMKSGLKLMYSYSRSSFITTIWRAVRWAEVNIIGASNGALIWVSLGVDWFRLVRSWWWILNGCCSRCCCSCCYSYCCYWSWSLGAASRVTTWLTGAAHTLVWAKWRACGKNEQRNFTRSAPVAQMNNKILRGLIRGHIWSRDPCSLSKPWELRSCSLPWISLAIVMKMSI